MTGEQLLAALDQRVATVAEALGVGGPAGSVGSAGDEASRLLPLLVDRCRESGSLPEAWLVLCAVQARWPWSDDVRQLRRAVRHQDTVSVVTRLLQEVLDHSRGGAPGLELDLVVDGVVVDADFCARHDYNSGIQRVARGVLPRWADAGHAFTTTAWTDSRDAARTLGGEEWQRVFAHRDTEAEDQTRPPVADADDARLVVPWRSTVVLVEVPLGPVCRSIAAMAELSGNELACVGYDTIPALDADLRPAAETEAFALYLSALKHARRVAALCRSSAAEFSGFASALASQGLSGPRVSTVTAPVAAVAPRTTSADAHGGRLKVLCAGAREPHKNQAAVVHASERLWQEGLDFELTLVGGAGWLSEDLDAYVAGLAERGRPIRPLGRVSDAVLDRVYREADVAVFVSLHEGFGLPAAEALASGTPLLTSAFGSLAEIAAAGGAVTADPRDDAEITDRLRELVTDAGLRERLATAARARPPRTWDAYAEELWAATVMGEAS